MKIVVMGTGQGLGGLHTHLQRLLRFLVGEGHETTAFVVADAIPISASRSTPTRDLLYPGRSEP